MEVSPLTQQARPSSFQPKIIGLYDDLFKQEDEDLAYSDVFWGEFFLLRPDKAGLERRLDSLTTDDLLHLQVSGQKPKYPQANCTRSMKLNSCSYGRSLK